MNIYKSIIEKNIDNNKEYCYLNNIGNNNIDDIIIDNSQIYKYKFLIKTNKREYKTHLIGKNNNYLTTLKDEKIYLKDIVSIEIIN